MDLYAIAQEVEKKYEMNEKNLEQSSLLARIHFFVAAVICFLFALSEKK